MPQQREPFSPLTLSPETHSPEGFGAAPFSPAGRQRKRGLNRTTRSLQCPGFGELSIGVSATPAKEHSLPNRSKDVVGESARA